MSHSGSRVVQPLQQGAIDIVGDVHGEVDALRSLVRQLGYDEGAGHPEGRHLVFVGDLCDRGPDSPAVLDLVLGWIGEGRAQGVLGNHELNVVLDAPKHGNGWYFDRNHDKHKGDFLHSNGATESQRVEWRRSLEALPLALERADLRVVHACWDQRAITALGRREQGESRASTYAYYESVAGTLLRETGVDHRAAAEIKLYRHVMEDPRAEVPLLAASAKEALVRQNDNPLKVLTSGLEAAAKVPAFAGGKWRMTDRVRWWHGYRDAPAVVVGHYWRMDARATPRTVRGDWDDPLDDYSAYEWMGPARNVFCVDYSVGRRHTERAAGSNPPFESRLAALRWPERELVFDDGERVATERYRER